MAATIEISLPDELVKALGGGPSELPRRAFESLVSDAYRAGRISHAQAGEMLGLDRWQTDAFVQEARAHRAGEPEEFADDLAIIRRLTSR